MIISFPNSSNCRFVLILLYMFEGAYICLDVEVVVEVSSSLVDDLGLAGL